MRFVAIRRFGQLSVIALAWCLWPAEAAAQAYPCPSGPGTGEVQVGMSPGGNGIASYPMCASDGGGASPPPTSYGSHAAMVWHRDAADVWVDGNYSGPNNVAKGNALEACNTVMGGGCEVASTWSNSSMTVLRDKAGSFYAAWNGEGGVERKRVMADCSSKQLLPCEVFATIKSSARRHSPGANVRKYFAASAWVVGAVTDGYNGKLYVASGYRNADAATAAAIRACHDATSRPCEYNALTGNGFIQAYTLNGGDDAATAENSGKRAQEAARANCRRMKATACELQVQFDSRKSGLFVHDFRQAKVR